MPAPAELGLQMVADALAAAFAEGEAGTACTRALCRIIPSLQFASLAVSHPAGAGPGFVAASNLATQGPTTLHLLDAGSCAASLALQKRRPLTASLHAGPAAAALASLADVRMLQEAAPTCQHLLCIPFGVAADGCGEQHPACLGQGCTGCSGALLLGLDGPALPPGRLVLLQLLAQRLPAALAALCADTLAFVNFACGAVATDAPSCACCCELEDSADEEEQGHSGDSCSSGRRGSGDGGAGPSTAMPLPVQAPHGVARDDDNPSCGNTDSEGSPSCSASTEKQTQAEALLPRPRLGGCASALPQHGQRPCSKALAAAVAGDSGGLEMHGLTLRFHSQLAEKEFGALRNPFYVATDSVAALLMLAAMVAVSFMQPFRAMYSTSLALSLGAGMPLPLAFTFVGRLVGWRSHQTWRERVVTALRLYALAFACLTGIPARQLPPAAAGLAGRAAAFLRLSGAEALFASAIGFLLPQHAHLPLQLAGMCACIAGLPHLCATAYPAACPATCVVPGAAAVAAFGFALPTLVLRCIERRARLAFAHQVRAAAGTL